MNRFLAISPQSQFWLFNFALALNILGMVLTDMWLPMVVGAIVTTYLSVDALVRLRYVLPMKKEIRDLRHELDKANRQLRDSYRNED
ncbi:hypothetical protein C9J03_20300 [Photobacterium gaetbulicola]|uniref:NADH dehydrogenase subunit II-like protein n=2 Tax=Photobacterium TaxID=657 RepID=A0A0C5WIV7_9GAMM|nr:MULTISPECIES: hypothetical protein [Photobacterium]AJR07073.1 NADH dehydrogenase subunit II-like protein [Photobacterium gaetbulicola Gung47]MDV5171791.1 hypothetical protein [Photobacterium rosenbergii]PSU03668.1 hypothetical protein C9J03_20300 [Photobacterium gaetbulicola]